MTQFLNNNRHFYHIHDALKKIRELTLNIVEYDSMTRIFENELYYILKNHTRNDQHPNVTRDVLLCELIDRCDGFYIKTPEVKKIIRYLSNNPDFTLNYTWFMKNVKNGYVPTSAIIYEVLDNLTIENIDKLLENKPAKFNKMKIFSNTFLLKYVFNKDHQTASDIFKKYNITKEQIIEIIEKVAFISNSYGYVLKKIPAEQFCTYVKNIFQYKKVNNQTLSYAELTMLVVNTQFDKIINNIYNVRDTNASAMEFVTTFKQISKKITDEQLITIIEQGFQSYNTIAQSYLEFIVNCCNFDTIDKSNIYKLIMKVPYYSKIPQHIFEKIYNCVLDINFITTLILNNQSLAVLELLKTPEKFNCSNEEIFKIAIEYSSIPLLNIFLIISFQLQKK